MSPNPMAKLDRLARSLAYQRGHPLLILYYPDAGGHVFGDDADDVYWQLRAAGVTKEAKLENLDVLLHTLGGDPTGAYRLGQTLRLLAERVEFLVPHHAFSAGSLLALSGDYIWLADNAGLSPFDITLQESTVPESEVSLASVDNFVEFAKLARERIGEMLQALGPQHTTDIDSDLLCEMVRQVGALKIGEYFRERLLTANYAEVLLHSYMFREQSNAQGKCNDVIEKMVHRSPSHEYFMDFHIAQNASLKVGQLDTETSDSTKEVISCLEDLAETELICFGLSNNYKVPMTRFYELADNEPGDSHEYATTQEDSTERSRDGHVDTTFGDVQEKETTTPEARRADSEKSHRQS